MARWIITDCRKLTKDEMAAIVSFKVVNDEYCTAMEFNTISSEPFKIPIHHLYDAEDFKSLKDIRILTLRSTSREFSICRVSPEDLPIVSWEQYLKEEEEAARRREEYAKAHPNDIFARLMPY